MFPLSRPAARFLVRFTVLVGLLFFYGLALSTTLSKAPTADEPAHLIRGVVSAQTGDLHLQLGHTPLAHRLIGFAVASERNAPDVQTLESWSGGDRLEIAAEFLWGNEQNVDRLFFLARLVNVWSALLLGAAIAAWALTWQGRLGTTVAIILFAFSPNLLASASLATTDMLTTTSYYLCVFCWWLYWRGKGKRYWWLTAVFLGLALASKLTAALLAPVLLLLALLFWRKGHSLWPSLGKWAALLPVAGTVLWLIYGLEFGPWQGLPFAAPVPSYWLAWQTVLMHVDSGHQAFFLGELSNQGWWYYFPLVFVIKTPLVTLALLIIAVGTIFLTRRLWSTAAFLSIPVAALFAAAMTSGLNIGYRHILPALPFLIVVASAAVMPLGSRKWTRLLLLLALSWTAAATVNQHPDHLAYFNEGVGGTAQGYRYLGDSNLDWGQDLKLLAQTMGEDAGNWHVSYSGAADPLAYGITESELIDDDNILSIAAANPRPGRYAISANHLQGILPDQDFFDWFRSRTPRESLGGSILIFTVEEQLQGAWVGHCLEDGRLLDNTTTEALLGTENIRHVEFDCAQTWVFPESGSAGWWIVPQADRRWIDDYLPDLAGGRMQTVYRHDAASGLPSFDVVYWAGGELSELAGSEPDVAKVDEQSIVLPFLLANRLWLEDYQVEGEIWTTLWRVEQADPEPLSLQAHLYDDAAQTAVADGLGFCCGQWLTGDRFIQRHQFPEGSAGREMETGLYNYLTLELVGPRVRLIEE